MRLRRTALAASIAIVAPFVPLAAGSAGAAGAAAATPLALPTAGCVEHFDGLSPLGGATLPPGAAFDETGTSALVNGAYGASDGSSNAGDVYSAGTSASTDRAFGSLLSGTLTPTLGVLVRNDTGATLTSLGVSYTTEQWRQGGTARFDRFDFTYSTTQTAVNATTGFTAQAALNGVGANGGSAANTVFNGNVAANRVAVSGAITGLSVPPSGTILLRWSDFNAGGADDLLAIDDLALAPNGAAAPTTACSAGGGGGGPVVTPIHTIQGSGATSPVAGQSATISGIVTGLDDEVGAGFGSGNSIITYPTDRGFFVQEEAADVDANPATSEGIFVGLSSSSAALPAIGDHVELTGTVKDGTSAPAFGQTRIETTSFTVVSSGNALPAAVTIDVAAANSQTVGSGTSPNRSYYETLEGMRVTLASGVAWSGGTNKFGELFLLPGTAAGVLLRTDAVQPGLLGTVEDAGSGNPANPYDPPTRSTTFVEADQNDTVQQLTGPFAYTYGNYKIAPQLGSAPTVVDTGAAYPFVEIPATTPGQVRVVSFNVENFFPVGGALDGHIIDQAEFDEKRDGIVDAIGRLLHAPDVIAVQEIGDNNHLGQAGGTSSLATLQTVATRLGELGYGSYTAYSLEGNDNRGIDVGFLVKSTVTVLAGPDQRGGLTAAGVCSDVSGRLFDRPPLFLEVDLGTAVGPTWIVSNHFASKSAPDSCREAQATWLRDQVALLEGAGDEVIVTGDLNAFEDEGALTILQDGTTTLTNLRNGVAHDEAYSFQFNGVLQTLDHLLVTDGLQPSIQTFTYAHFDNDYAARTGQPDGHHVSDHDPPTLTFAAAPGTEVPEASAPWVLAVTGGALMLVLAARRRRQVARSIS